MKDAKTKQELVKEIKKLRTRVVALEKSKRQQTQIENALREAEQFNREVIAGAGEGIAVYDRAFRYMLWNKFMENLTGVPASQVLGKNGLEVFPHLREQGIDRLLEQALAGEIACSADTPYHVPQTGKSGWVTGTYAPHRDANGRIIGVVATIHDISERKHVEDALQKSEQYVRSIIDSSLDMIITVDNERRIVEFNKAAQETFGYICDEVIGQHVDLLYANPIAGHDVHRIALELGKNIQEVLNKRKNGEVFVSHVSAATMRDASGTFLGIVGVSRDITEQKRAEEALAREQYLLNTLMDNIPDYVYFKDAQNRFIRTNRAHAKAFGLSDPAEAVGKTDFDFFTEEHARRAYEDEQRIIRTGQPIVGQVEKETWSDHPVTWVSTTKMPLRDEKGNIVGTFGISRDIAERKQVEEKLATKVTELKQRNDEITLLNETDDLLQTCLTTQEAYTVVAQAAQKLFLHESGALCIIAPSRNFVETVATWGESLPPEQVFVPDDCWALRRGQAHRVVDPRSGLLCRHIRQPLTAGYMCLPMMAQGETLGILHLQSGQPNPSQTEEEQESPIAAQQRLAVALADHIALALANLRLRDALRSQAIRDPLTGLFNRRYMEETLERELRRAERRQVKLGLMLFDLDHFKRFNDVSGHPAGDMVLREIGTFLRTNLRAEDVACRYGGEEFIVILPEVSFDNIMKRAEQLREGIKRLNVQYQDRMLGAVTISVGVAVFPDHGLTAEAIMRQADAALYSAKREGRDRVVVASGRSE